MLATAMAVLACEAHAQTPAAKPAAPAKPAASSASAKPAESADSAAPAVSPDGLANDEMYMEADHLTREDKAGITIGEGNVEIRYQGRTLRADRVVYTEGPDDQPGVIRGYGHVQVINSDGSVEFADEFIFDDKMSAGVARGFSARMAQNSKIAGSTAVRRSGTIQELERAIYTPCDVCTPKGKAQRPTWSIRATRAVQDKKRHLIFYRNAEIRIKGITFLYLPVFWHADPTAERVSGLLTPSIGYGDRRGFTYEQPYLWTATPSMDVIVSPQINTKVNPFLNMRLRKRFYTGDMDLRVGYTYETDFNSNGQKFGDDTSRSYILGRGAFQITNDWLVGFTAERVSDRLIFDKYDISSPFEARGPYVPDDRRLISQAYGIRQTENSYFSSAIMSIQGLQGAPGNPSQLENQAIIPTIAPLIEGRYDLPTEVLGGHLRLLQSAVALTRDESPDNPAMPGIDSRRFTAEADWRRSFTLPIGLRVDPYISVRGDAYNLHDVPNEVGSGVHSMSLGRALATAGADLSYPFYRRWNDATIVLEPYVQFAMSPPARQVITGWTAPGQPNYFDEDSTAFEFDETNLFRIDKAPGYDLYEDGVRVALATRASVLWDDGRRANLIVGRSFRNQTDNIFTVVSGLYYQASDWVVAADAEPIKGLTFFGRARLDATSFAPHRLEAGANISTRWGSGFIRYLHNDAGVAGQPDNSTGGKAENMDLGGNINATQHWGVSFYGNRDFTTDTWVIRDVGVFYHDDCVRMEVYYRREDTVIGQLGPSNQVGVRLTLATLGK
jgi:LPS-assembly protein